MYVIYTVIDEYINAYFTRSNTSYYYVRNNCFTLENMRIFHRPVIRNSYFLLVNYKQSEGQLRHSIGWPHYNNNNNNNDDREGPLKAQQ